MAFDWIMKVSPLFPFFATVHPLVKEIQWRRAKKLRMKQPSGFVEKATKTMEKEKALPKVTG